MPSIGTAARAIMGSNYGDDLRSGGSSPTFEWGVEGNSRDSFEQLVPLFDSNSDGSVEARTHQYESAPGGAEARRGEKRNATMDSLEGMPAISRRKKKPKGTPKRPRNAYALFFQRERSKLLESEGGDPNTSSNSPTSDVNNNRLSFEELEKIIGMRWRSLSASEREELENLASQDSVRYRNEMESFKDEKKKHKAEASAAVAQQQQQQQQPQQVELPRNEPEFPRNEPPPLAHPPPSSIHHHRMGGGGMYMAPPSPSSSSRNIPAHLHVYQPAPPSQRPPSRHMHYPPSPHANAYPIPPHVPQPPRFSTEPPHSAHYYPPPPPPVVSSAQGGAVAGQPPLRTSSSSSHYHPHHPPPHPHHPPPHHPAQQPLDHFPIPPGMELMLPDRDGRERKYKVQYACYTMTREAAQDYVDRLSNALAHRTHPPPPPRHSSSPDEESHHARRPPPGYY